MLYIGKNQLTEEIIIEDNVEIKDTEDREESAEKADWNHAEKPGTGGNCVS